MFVLVFWIITKDFSIVQERDLCPNADEGEETMVKYKDNKKYKAKILKKSYDEQYLRKIRVSSNGEIMPMKHQSSKGEKRKREEILQKLPGVFDTNHEKSNDEIIKKPRIRLIEESDEEEIDKDIEDEESSIDDTNSSSKKTEDDDDDNDDFDDHLGDDLDADGFHNDNEMIEKRVREREERERAEEARKVREREERERAEEARRVREREERERAEEAKREREREERERAEQARRVLEREERERAEEARRVREREERDRAEEARREREREERMRLEQMNGLANPQQVDENDQLVRCRQARNGRVPLVTAYNVWIDKARLVYFQRYLNSPKDLTRHLLKELVGEGNLYNMCARGKSKVEGIVPIPQDIVSAVEYYVNRKCSFSLKPGEFTNTINFMIGSIRHPRR
ncbi:hypothetical protein TKK_0016414 [Trichogramma kaykai]